MTAQRATAKPTINTVKFWDDTTLLNGLSCSDGWTDQGQMITIPQGKANITKVTWPMSNANDYPQSVTVRAEVYAWDTATHMATGENLAESRPKTLHLAFRVWRNVSFQLDASVTPGKHYIAFVTLDKDLDTCQAPDDGSLSWGAVNNLFYPRGSVVTLNAAGDTSKWTTTPWKVGRVDTALKVFMG